MNFYFSSPLMKESQFVKDNSHRWGPLEKTLRTLKKSKFKKELDENLGDDFVRLTDDLGYSQTFYRRRSIRLYLNNLTSDLYRLIHQHREKGENPFVKLFFKDVPSIMYHGRKAFFLSFIIFGVAMTIGAVSLHLDSEFARTVLGDYYIDMTNENIENGDPMAVYKDTDSWDMFTRIALNNMWVLIFCFVMGLFFGIGSAGALMSNGVMLGVFQYYFYQKGLLWTSFLTIWQHGTVEISSIVIGGGAGLLLGSGYLFPGSYSRLLSLRLKFYQGMKIILVLAPFIIFAAWVEAYVTRHDDMFWVYRLIFIVINFAMIVGYFVYAPYRYGKRLNRIEDRPDNDTLSSVRDIDTNDVHNAAETFQLSIQGFQHFLVKKVWWIALSVIGFGVYLKLGDLISAVELYWFGGGGIAYVETATVSMIYAIYNTFILFELGTWEIPMIAAIFVGFITLVQVVAARHVHQPKDTKHLWITAIQHFVIIGLSCFTLRLGWGMLAAIILYFIPVSSLALSRSLKSGELYITSLGKSFATYFQQFALVVGWTFLFGISVVILIALIQGSVSTVILYFLNSFVAFDQSGDPSLLLTILFVLSFISLLVALAFGQIGYGLSINSIHERQTAEKLRSSIQSIPPRKKRYGIDEQI